MATKTKSVGGKDYPASTFAYVGDPEDTSTWHLPIPDEAHVRDALARFNQAQIPSDKKAAVAHKLAAAAKRYGIDASGFEKEYLSKQSAGQNVVVLLACESSRFENGAEDGLTWPMVVMESGFARGEVMTDDPALKGLPHYFPQEVVAQVAEACKSTRFGRRHPQTDGEEFDPSRIAGLISGGVMEGSAARASVRLFETETELKTKLMAAQKSNQLGLFGASILGLFAWKKGKAEGKDALVAQRLARLMSVDLVTEAGAGGKILPYAASRSVRDEIAAIQTEFAAAEAAKITAAKAADKKGAVMKEQILKVLEALRKKDAGRATELQKEFEGLAEDKHSEFWVKLSEALVAEPVQAADKGPKPEEILAKANEALAAAKKLETRNLIERKVSESKLPVPAMAVVREHLAERVADGAQLDEAKIDAEIKKVRESFAAFANVGRVNGGTASVGRDTVDKVSLAMEAMFGVREAKADKSVAPFRGIREAYMVITGDNELADIPRGGFYKTQQAWATTNFPNVLLNALTKKLIQDYAEQPYQYLDKLYTKAIVGDFKTQHRIRMGYLAELSAVAEAGAYTEIARPTDEDITYAVSKFGNLLTVTEETIRNDDLGKMLQIPSRLARAGRIGLAQFISNFFINNPNYAPDSVAWFASGHNNLSTALLSSAALDAAQLALQSQTEKDSALPLSFSLDWLMVPPGLYPTARQINRNPTGTNNWYQRFGANDENIFVNPLLTDAVEWFCGAFPAQAPSLEIGFLDGFDMPQIFLANLPTQGTMFTNDELQYKVKFVYGGNILDFRPVYAGKNS
jgi:hypothetical protein